VFSGTLTLDFNLQVETHIAPADVRRLTFDKLTGARQLYADMDTGAYRLKTIATTTLKDKKLSLQWKSTHNI
jgi:hypothetical protein